MRFDVLTLFPDMVHSSARVGVTGRAIECGRVCLKTWNPRDYALDNYQRVDDRPFGGGAGMVMLYQPLRDALKSAQADDATPAKVICLSPQGKIIHQSMLQKISLQQRLILVAGRYEGMDERFIAHHCDEEWSLGDYVVSGGELAALVIIDALTRLLPDVLGNAQSAQHDSHSIGLLDYPHYTRPESVDGYRVPPVLLSGHHGEIDVWRAKQAIGRTWQKRPDLLEKKILTAQETAWLLQFKNEVNHEVKQGN